MFDRQALINRVDSYLRRELVPVDTSKVQMLSITLPVQEIHLRTLPKIEGDWFFWDRPTEDECILGLGEAMRITASGHDRLEKLNLQMQKIHNQWEWIDLELTGCRPISFFCFAFNPDDPMQKPWHGLPNSGVFLPQITLQQHEKLLCRFIQRRPRQEPGQTSHPSTLDETFFWADPITEPTTQPTRM